jgi:hypothetical protein
MVYNTKYICTYNSPEVFTESDNINEDEMYFVREAIYRQDLLNILDVDDYDENKLNLAIHELYEKIKDSKDIMECIYKLAGNFLSEEPELGLTIMFAYDYLNLAHLCISDYLESGQISEENLSNLKNIVFSE